MTTESAHYCVLVNQLAWSRSRVFLLKLEVDLASSFGVRAWTGMEIRYVKGMYRLKLVSSRVFKGLKVLHYTEGCAGPALYAGLFSPFTIHRAVQAQHSTQRCTGPALFFFIFCYFFLFL